MMSAQSCPVGCSLGMFSNPFVGTTVASRYATARPALHGEAIGAVRDIIGTPRAAVDIGCGTGLSTLALVGYAQSVIGIDSSRDMLAHARRGSDVSYLLGEAEHLPFKDGVFGLATVASAIHWFRQPAIEEVRRVLAADGNFLIYDVQFGAEMKGVDAFANWMAGTCAPKYPHVTRNEHHDLAGAGFSSLRVETLLREVPMTLDELTDYLMTHSERIAAVADGRESDMQQRTFISQGLSPLYQAASVRSLVFGINVEIFVVR
jgi:SAM-dependent methyltransferase